MKQFNCKVRIMGEVKDEVAREGVTNAEITVLRAIHGHDGVVDVQQIAGAAQTKDPVTEEFRDRTEAEERFRLEQFYGEAIVGRLFGAPVATIGDAQTGVLPLEPPVRADPPPPVPPVRAKKLELEDV